MSTVEALLHTDALPELDHKWIEEWKKEGPGLFLELEEQTEKRNQFKRAIDAIQWEIGAWILRGEERLGTKGAIDAAMEAAPGRKPKTIKDYMYVAKTFPPSRRRDGLSWSLYKELWESGLSSDLQDSLLKSVAESSKKESVSDLRRQIRKLKDPLRSKKDPLGKAESKLTPGEHVQLLRAAISGELLEFERKREMECGGAQPAQKRALDRKFDRIRKRIPLGDLVPARWRCTYNRPRVGASYFRERYDGIYEVVTEGLRAHGQLNPIHVYPSPREPGKYTIIDGHIVADCAKKVGVPDLEAEVYLDIDETAAKLLTLWLNFTQMAKNHIFLCGICGELAEELGGWPKLAEKVSWNAETVEDYVGTYQRRFDWKEFNYVPGADEVEDEDGN